MVFFGVHHVIVPLMEKRGVSVETPLFKKARD
jgi:hypothetical protein